MLEHNKLYCGNCLDLMSEIPDNSIDMILTDLPFGTTQCKWDIRIPFVPLWEQYERVIKDNGAIVLFGTQPFTSLLVSSNLKLFRYELIWEKERPTNIFFMKKQIGKVHENILVFYKKQPTYNPQMEDRKFNTTGVFGKEQKSKTHKNQIYKYSKDYDKTKVYPRSVIKINRDTLNGSSHPTQKPVALCEYLIRTYTNPGDLVLDSCIGSGTTAVAAIKTERKYIGIEIYPVIVEIAQRRIKEVSLNV